MKVAFRTDASLQMGTGHLMRCLTLAGKLRTKGVRVSFICRELPGHMCDFIAGQGFVVSRLPAPVVDVSSSTTAVTHASWLGVEWLVDAEETSLALATDMEVADWLVVDHYALDIRWEEYLRPSARRIMVIDDLADRQHDSDLLLDQNYYCDMENRYTDLVPEQCRLLLGPRYALLRDEFSEFSDVANQRDGSVDRVLIFFGGSDPSRETERALASIRLLDRLDMAVDVVVGGINERQEQVRELCTSMPNCRYHCQTDDMAGLMAKADVFVGAGGGSSWERCALGLPSIIISIARNQDKVCEDLAVAGAIRFLGLAGDVDAAVIADALIEWLHDPEKVRAVGLCAAQIANAQGGDRVIEVMCRENL